MIDAVAMIEALAAEKRQFEEELDRKSSRQDGFASRQKSGLRGVRRVMGRVRQLANGAQMSQISESPATC